MTSMRGKIREWRQGGGVQLPLIDEGGSVAVNLYMGGGGVQLPLIFTWEGGFSCR